MRMMMLKKVLNSLLNRDHFDDRDDEEEEDETKCESTVLFAAKLFDRDVSHNFVCRRFFLGDR